MKNLNLTVVGSFMMDLVVRTPRIPSDGETVIGLSFGRFPGGKGANQAVAAARLGADVTMIGKLGTDGFGDEMLATLNAEKINTEHILRDEAAASGVASIMLEESGRNRIVVVPGANLRYTPEDLRSVEHIISKSDIVMMQMEIDMSVIEEGVALTAKHQVPVLLNPAPAQELSNDVLRRISYLTPNETETEILTGIKVVDVETAKEGAKALLAKGVRNVVITLGEKGALVADETNIQHIPGFTVKPVDTVAAGDAFNGAFAVGVIQGKSLADAARYANAVGALAVTKNGAIPSLPRKKDVELFLQERM